MCGFVLYDRRVVGSVIGIRKNQLNKATFLAGKIRGRRGRRGREAERGK